MIISQISYCWNLTICYIYGVAKLFTTIKSTNCMLVLGIGGALIVAGIIAVNFDKLVRNF